MALMLRSRRAFVNSTASSSDGDLDPFDAKRCGSKYNAWFWAKKVLVMIETREQRIRDLANVGTLPPTINIERTWGETRNDMYAHPFQGPLWTKLPDGEAFWGPIRFVDDHPRAPASQAREPALRSFAQKLASGVFAHGPRVGGDVLCACAIRTLAACMSRSRTGSRGSQAMNSSGEMERQGPQATSHSPTPAPCDPSTFRAGSMTQWRAGGLRMLPRRT
jgi:hypothetical protein